jgi:hypothetical protein
VARGRAAAAAATRVLFRRGAHPRPRATTAIATAAAAITARALPPPPRHRQVSVACEVHRTQGANRKEAVAKLAALVVEAWRPPKERRQREGISHKGKRARREDKRCACHAKLREPVGTPRLVAAPPPVPRDPGAGPRLLRRVAQKKATRGNAVGRRRDSRRALLAAAAAGLGLAPAPRPCGPGGGSALLPAAADEEGAGGCDDACRARIAERRLLFEQSRTTNDRQKILDLSRQRAALYNTSFRGASCIPGVPCL